MNEATADFKPFIVGIGGTTRENSSSEIATRIALEAAEALGARTAMFAGADLDLPMYDPQVPERTAKAEQLVEALRRCDGVIMASPGYHGSLSGMIKNALDYVEDLREDDRVYFDGRAVGVIACAYGWQATGTTLTALRSIVHALRGWPTPVGVAVNSIETKFSEDGSCDDDKVLGALQLLARQVVDFSRMANNSRASY